MDEKDLKINELKEELKKYKRTGHWIHGRIYVATGGTYLVTRCSVCQNAMPFEWEAVYCPNCGARMKDE